MKGNTTLTLLIVVAAATSAGAAEQVLVGAIGDSLCGTSHAGMPTKMTDRECTQTCAAKGAQYVLVSDGKMYKLINHEADLKTHAGHSVTLTGEVKGNTVHVTKVEMPKAKD
jgi:hypothetical protein